MDVSLADQSREQLVARISNYEEGMAEAIENLQGIPEAGATLLLLQTLLMASGKEHLQAMEAFDLAVSATLAFKDRVLAGLTSPSCPQCGVAPNEDHLPSCLVGTALKVLPPHLPELTQNAAVNLAGLHLRLHRLLNGPLNPQDVRQALHEFPV